MKMKENPFFNHSRIKRTFVEQELTKQERAYLNELENKIKNTNDEESAIMYNHHIREIIDKVTLRKENKELKFHIKQLQKK